MSTHDCEPTLNDKQVLDFCKDGFLMLEGVVPDEINRRTLEYLGEHPEHEATQILLEDWFDENVIKNPRVAGAVRSLLGKNFGLPNHVANHRSVCPMPAQEWHTDGGSKYGPEMNYLMAFYYPQDCPKELGPTELLPASHFLFSWLMYMGHYGRIRGSHHAVVPAGSVLIFVYHIWHRRSESTGEGIRNNLKFNYWRTVPPQRDWIIDPDFDIASADYSHSLKPQLQGGGPIYRYRRTQQDSYDDAEMYFWLRGQSDKYRIIGGPAWPAGPTTSVAGPYGMPAELAEEKPSP